MLDDVKLNVIGEHCVKYVKSANYGINKKSFDYRFCCVQFDFCEWYNQDWFLYMCIILSFAFVIIYLFSFWFCGVRRYTLWRRAKIEELRRSRRNKRYSSSRTSDTEDTIRKQKNRGFIVIMIISKMSGKYAVLVFFGQVGPYCRKYYQEEKYSKCAEDESCQKSDDDYDFCCTKMNYCNFYSTNWFFWLMFFLVFFMIAGSIFGCIYMRRKKRGGGRGENSENYDEPSDTI